MLYVLISICLSITNVSAEMWYVGSEKEFTTIQEAIQEAGSGDVVIVDPGTYHENINFLGKNITVTSTAPGDLAVVTATVIEGDGTGSVVTFANEEGPEAVISGFTITGGYGTSESSIGNYIYFGGGVFCYNSSPSIIGNVIINNHGPSEMEGDDPENWTLGYGGGIGGYMSNAIISRNIIFGNDGYAGGGVLVIGGQAKVSNNLIYENLAIVGGGVVLLGGELINNTITNNSGDIAGNVYSDEEAESGQCIIANNIITGAVNGGGIYANESVSIIYNDVWNNAGGNYMEMADQTGINGNISSSPLFFDAAGKDFRLLPGSSCIDTGTNNPGIELSDVDFAGQIRVTDGDFNGDPVVDMGAFETEGSTDPVIYTSDNKLSFIAFEGDVNPENQMLTIRNGGQDILNWTINESCDWLEVTPLAGSSSGSNDQTEIYINVNADGMSPGSYGCTFEVSSPEALNSPKSIVINLYVGTEGEILVPMMAETIQEAIDMALEGNTVIVSPGVYHENINFGGKNVTLTSIDPTDMDIVSSTTIRGLGNDSVVTFGSIEDETCVLTGFTITGGYTTVKGAGINGNESQATVSHCMIRNNFADECAGGGIWGIHGR
jgi:hypothetical protein